MIIITFLRSFHRSLKNGGLQKRAHATNGSVFFSAFPVAPREIALKAGRVRSVLNAPFFVTFILQAFVKMSSYLECQLRITTEPISSLLTK